jgi:GH35 family endo-1,4-beta-xylanase
MLVSSISVAGNSGDVAAKAKKAPKLNATSKNLEVGKSTTVKVKANGTKIKKTTWKTNKKKVATVKGKKTSAKITAKGKGTAKITATVKYNGGKKKLTCTVKVKEAEVKATDAPAATTVAATQAAAATATQQAVTQPTTAPTEAPTPAPTPKPYYYDYHYFGKFDASKATQPNENMYINFVLSDSWSTNTKLSAINSLEFKVDSDASAIVDLWVAEYDCDISSGSAKKICDFEINGTKGQDINLVNEIAGNADIAALDSTGNGRLSFGFAPQDGKTSFIIHDMYVNYKDNNFTEEAHHEAAISEETCCIGSAKTAYTTEKKAVEDANKEIDKLNEGKPDIEKLAKQSFDKTLKDYLNEKPAGMFETLPKDASKAIEDYPLSMAKITESLGYKFGTCVTYNLIKNDPEFCKLLAHHCDSITAMNEFKAYSLLDKDATQKAYEEDPNGAMPQMKYQKADEICEWARANNIKIRGHALVWDNAMEENHRWFFTEGYDQNGTYASNDVCRERLKYYVEQVMRHFQEKYPDVVYCWDVVNEGIDENSSDKLKVRQNRGGQNPFYYHCSSEANGKGENYIKFTFDCAYDAREKMIEEGLLKPDKEGDDIVKTRQKIELVYNDYNVIESNKRPYVQALVKELNSEPGRQLVDTVGCQGYLGDYQKQGSCLRDEWWQKPVSTIELFAQMDPPVHVQLTEMAMRNFEWSKLDDHGDFAARLFQELANINETTNNSFTSMSIWAFIDDPVMNKVEESFDYWQYAPFSGMFDDVYRAKPAFQFAYQILKDKAEQAGLLK